MVKKAVLLTAGVAIGVAMMALPASSHVVEGGGSAVAHVVDHMKQYFFTKSRSDERYANAVSNTDKARNADQLDGMDSSFFVKGAGRVAGFQETSGHNGSTVGLTGFDGIGSVSGQCEIGTNAKLFFANGSGGSLDAWWSNKAGHHFATVANSAVLDLTASSAVDDFVVLHLSGGGKTATFTVAQHPQHPPDGNCAFSANGVATGG